MSGSGPDSSCTVKTKFRNIIYACKHIGYHYLQHFLKRPFYKFGPILLLTRHNSIYTQKCLVLVQICVLQIKQSLLMYFKHI